MSRAAFMRELMGAIAERAAPEAVAESKPLRLFHGTNKTDPLRRMEGKQGFDELSPDISEDQLGLHMGSVPQANSFAAWRPENTDEEVMLNPHYFWSKASLEDARVVPLDVEIRNPLRLEDREGNWLPDHIYKQLADQGKLELDNNTFDELRRMRMGKDQQPVEAMRRIREIIEGLGHDSVVYKNRVEGMPSGLVHRRLAGLDHAQMADDEFAKYVPEAQDSYIVWDRKKYRSPFGEGTGAGFSMGGPVGALRYGR